MNLELTPEEISALKYLIFREIDRVGGLDLIDSDYYDILMKIVSKDRDTL
jgi:hypothetical protein